MVLPGPERGRPPPAIASRARARLPILAFGHHFHCLVGGRSLPSRREQARVARGGARGGGDRRGLPARALASRAQRRARAARGDAARKAAFRPGWRERAVLGGSAGRARLHLDGVGTAGVLRVHLLLCAGPGGCGLAAGDGRGQRARRRARGAHLGRGRGPADAAGARGGDAARRTGRARPGRAGILPLPRAGARGAPGGPTRLRVDARRSTGAARGAAGSGRDLRSGPSAFRDRLAPPARARDGGRAERVDRRVDDHGGGAARGGGPSARATRARASTTPRPCPGPGARPGPAGLTEAGGGGWLDEYARAWSRKDLRALRRMGQVRSAAEEEQLERYFRSVDGLHVAVRVLALRLDGARAAVELER